MSRATTLIVLTTVSAGSLVVAIQRSRLIAKLGRGTTVRSVRPGGR